MYEHWLYSYILKVTWTCLETVWIYLFMKFIQFLAPLFGNVWYCVIHATSYISGIASSIFWQLWLNSSSGQPPSMAGQEWEMEQAICRPSPWKFKLLSIRAGYAQTCGWKMACLRSLRLDLKTSDQNINPKHFAIQSHPISTSEYFWKNTWAWIFFN